MFSWQRKLGAGRTGAGGGLVLPRMRAWEEGEIWFQRDLSDWGRAIHCSRGIMVSGGLGLGLEEQEDAAKADKVPTSMSISKEVL